jgi:Acetyltransferase (GNAT) domain
MISRGIQAPTGARVATTDGESSIASERPLLTNIPQAYVLFQQPWWLDAAAPGAWDEVRVERDGKILARLPFMTKRKFGFTAITHPPHSAYLGPWLAPDDGKNASQLGRQKELMLELIAQLPPYDVCRIQFAPEVTNWLPFFWAGFTVTPYVTYRLPNLRDEDALWANVDSLARTAIRKARKQIAVRTDLGIEALLELQERTYTRHGWVMRDRDFYYRVDEACRARGCCQNFVAEDASGRRHAAYYIVWDDNCAYAIGGGMNQDLAKSQAGVLVRWESVRFARAVTKTFDFRGSRSEMVERSFRRLGGQQVTFLALSKFSSRMRVLDAARGLVASIMER